MEVDIIAIDTLKPINNKTAVCSTLPTGATAKRLVRKNHPVALTIQNIQFKFNDRFDDPKYYCNDNS